jgi:hypothetical protein
MAVNTRLMAGVIQHQIKPPETSSLPAFEVSECEERRHTGSDSNPIIESRQEMEDAAASLHIPHQFDLASSVRRLGWDKGLAKQKKTHEHDHLQRLLRLH